MVRKTRRATCECGHTFMTSKDKPQCGQCGKSVKNDSDVSMKVPITDSIPSKGGIPVIPRVPASRDTIIPRNIKLPAKALYIAEQLINQKKYKDLDDVAVNAIENMNMPSHHNGLLHDNPIPKQQQDVLKKRNEVLLKEEELRMAKLNNELKELNGINDKGNNNSGGDLGGMMDRMLKQKLFRVQMDDMLQNMERSKGGNNMDPMMMMMFMKMMDNQNNNNQNRGNGFQDEMVKMMMLKFMSGGNNNGGSKDIDLLREQIKKMGEERQQKQMMELIKSVSSKRNDDGLTPKDFIALMEKRQTSTQLMDNELRKEREARQKAEMDVRIKEIESGILNQGTGMSKDKIEDLKETINSLKDAAKAFGKDEDKKPSNNELIADVIKTATSALAPAAQEYVQYKRETTGTQPKRRQVPLDEVTDDQFKRLSPEDQQAVLEYRKQQAQEETQQPQQAMPSGSDHSSLINIS